ncbi:saccharopine dehydrogenase NADP-binding domain-containing protein [candidate division KSB1 bacterium]|nr:saccharopine dehydrogenase NADP-binding domain-containing protein [candidate division KSB1 bacterium]
MNIVVLGAGLIGKAIAVDLASEFHVTAVDIKEDNLDVLRDRKNILVRRADLTDHHTLEQLIKDADLVINAVPGHMGFETLESVIKCGKNIVDISFFAQDPFALDILAKQKNVTAVVDCGVAPGMGNLILGYHNNRMNVKSFECYVGGLPVTRTWPFEYKAPFSPSDVLEEYTRPARLVENGAIVTKPALSEPELMEFEGIGTLEAFNTDGLRTLLATMRIPYMKEKTLRYPGHIRLLKIFRETGFFDTNEITINGVPIRPVDFTSRLLFPKWKLGETEDEFTVMKIIIKGEQDNKIRTIEYFLYDRYDPESRTSSMARTTGYTCTVVARLVLNGDYREKGISPPEYLGVDENNLKKILTGLRQRNIHYIRTEK